MSVHPQSQVPPSGPALPGSQGAGGHRRAWQVVAAVVAVALLAGVAGVFIGRITKAGAPKSSLSASWRPLPPAPIAGRIAASAVWTGKEMIVWGGGMRSGPVGPASDGAAYNPATRAWRTIAPAPAGVRGGAGNNGAAWTGDEIVVWASNSPDGPVGGAVYDPRADTWRRLPAGPLGKREGYTSVWTGKELLVLGGNLGDTIATPTAAAVNPQTGSWRVLKALAAFKGLMPNGAVWDGREAIVMGRLVRYGQSEARPILVAYNPATDAVREIPLPAPSETFGADSAASLKLIGWTGREVVFSTDAAGSIQIIRYNPTVGGWKGVPAGRCHIVDNPAQGRGCRDWRKGPYAPCAIPVTQYTQVAWLGDRYVAACGEDGLQIYSLPTNTWTWRTLTPGPSPLNSRWDSAIVWTGADLIAWSGTVQKRGNPTPADGASLTLKG